MFGERVRCLGYLLDDALAKELRECSAVALFFDPAVRANNTTFWAAIEAERLVITNLDADSPIGPSLTVRDIEDLRTWPPRLWPEVVDRVHSWDNLLRLMGVGVEV